ncbi:hypothetical protein ACHAXR_002126 [Thalassiosira sp. AJA248-18]
MQSFIPLLVFLHMARIATSFCSAPIIPTLTKTTTSSSAVEAVAPWQSFLDTLFADNNNNNSNKATTNTLKQQLLSECQQSYGRNTPEIRNRIETIMSQLAPINPTPQTAKSPLLKRKWILEWTSEKEINFFLEKGFSVEIIQTLDGSTLENYIPFVKGGGFGVTGDISVDEESEGLLRTNFKFKNANLDIGRWGEYNFPPVGEGWFDTIYLDEGLRIDTNSRDDILICRAE